jgi:hypothetical protein
MKEDKFSATAFVSMLITLLAIAVLFAINNNKSRLIRLEEKIQVRDSVILRMQDAQERQDSVMFDYLDKWIYRLYNND